MITVERYGYLPFGTMGKITYNDFSCYTIERQWENNLAFKSCIPEGVYDISWYNSPKFGEVLAITGNGISLYPDNINPRSSILIHPGNTFNDVEGCIAVGDVFSCVNGVPGVLNSVLTLRQFFQVLRSNNFTTDKISIYSNKNGTAS